MGGKGKFVGPLGGGRGRGRRYYEGLRGRRGPSEKCHFNGEARQDVNW